MNNHKSHLIVFITSYLHKKKFFVIFFFFLEVGGGFQSDFCENLKILSNLPYSFGLSHRFQSTVYGLYDAG